MNEEVSSACPKQTLLQTAFQLAGESHHVALGCVMQHYACPDVTPSSHA